MEFLNEQYNAPLATMEDTLAAANELEDDAAASDEEANLSEDAGSDDDFASASEDEAHDDDEDAAASDSEDHAPDDDEDNAASVSEDEGSQHKRIKLIDEPSSFFEPEWHFKIKTPKETVSSTQIIAAKDISLSGIRISKEDFCHFLILINTFLIIFTDFRRNRG